jgi:hypothetical protein
VAVAVLTTQAAVAVGTVFSPLIHHQQQVRKQLVVLLVQEAQVATVALVQAVLVQVEAQH